MQVKSIIGIALILVTILTGCSMFSNGGFNISPETAQGIVIEQSVDTFGYVLGLFAAKDPEFKEEVDHYYKEVKVNGLTLTVVNEIMAKFRSKDIAYQVLIYKLTSLIRLMGGTFDQSGSITSFGEISNEYLEVGKNAYLAAIRNVEVDSNE